MFLGEARDDGRRPRIAKPGTKGGCFLILRKSEQQLTKAAQTDSRILGVLSTMADVAAVVVLAMLLAGII